MNYLNNVGKITADARQFASSGPLKAAQARLSHRRPGSRLPAHVVSAAAADLLAPAAYVLSLRPLPASAPKPSPQDSALGTAPGAPRGSVQATASLLGALGGAALRGLLVVTLALSAGILWAVVHAAYVVCRPAKKPASQAQAAVQAHMQAWADAVAAMAKYRPAQTAAPAWLRAYADATAPALQESWPVAPAEPLAAIASNSPEGSPQADGSESSDGSATSSASSFLDGSFVSVSAEPMTPASSLQGAISAANDARAPAFAIQPGPTLLAQIQRSFAAPSARENAPGRLDARLSHQFEIDLRRTPTFVGPAEGQGMPETFTALRMPAAAAAADNAPFAALEMQRAAQRLQAFCGGQPALVRAVSLLLSQTLHNVGEQHLFESRAVRLGDRPYYLAGSGAQTQMQSFAWRLAAAADGSPRIAVAGKFERTGDFMATPLDGSDAGARESNGLDEIEPRLVVGTLEQRIFVIVSVTADGTVHYEGLEFAGSGTLEGAWVTWKA